MSNQNGMEDMHNQHIRPPDHQMYPQQQDQYYGHYDHHNQNYMHHQGYNQQQQQQQWYPQQEYQQYGYNRMPQEQYHHQMYDQMQPMHPQNQPQMHPQQPHLEKTWSNPPQETSASNPEPVKPSSEEEDSSSPRKKVSPSKKVKKKVKVKPKTTNAAKAKLAKVVTKKKDKKVSLTKEELAKYPDENLREVVLKMKNGCDCPENCFKPFNAEMVYKHRLDIQDLTKNCHDMYLMGMTMACMGIPTERHDGKERKKQRAKYRFWGKEVCANAFLYLENTTFYQIKSIRKHMMHHGVSPRSHGNLGRIPHNTFSLDNYQFATRFLHAYFEKHAIKDKKAKQGIIKLPKNITFKTIHDAYQAYGAEVNEPSVRLMSYSTFRGFLREQFPNLKLDAVTPAKGHSTTASAVASSKINEDNGPHAAINAASD